MPEVDAVRRRSTAGQSLALCLAVLCLAGSLAGCTRGTTSERPPIHLNPNMDHQPSYRAQSASEFFYDGSTMRPPVPGTVARGELWEDTAFYHGKDASGAPVAASPLAVDEAVLARGAERYGIYCQPCHGENGNGRGVLYERAAIQSGDMVADERIRGLSDGELFDVITNGVGLMSGYKYPIPPRDRWAVIAHVRTLQREGGP